jgi:hypothetical protein
LAWKKNISCTVWVRGVENADKWKQRHVTFWRAPCIEKKKKRRPGVLGWAAMGLVSSCDWRWCMPKREKWFTIRKNDELKKGAAGLRAAEYVKGNLVIL